VPHGGVVTSALLRVAALHFATTLSPARQPHTIIAHVEFLRRTRAGRGALVAARDVKVGRQTSTVHLSLSQDDDILVVAYVTNGTDLSLGGSGGGVSLETGWALHPPPPPPPADFARLAAGRGEDAHWAELRERPFAEFRGAMGRLRMFVPRARARRPRHVVEEWVRFASGERFTNESVGFVSDAWPQLLEEGWGADPPPAAVEGGKEGKEKEKQQQQEEDGKAVRERQRKAWHWYPTLVLNLDVKKALPPEGVEWLFVRLHAKQVKNGRLDYEIVIMDQTGDIVALSHHVVMVVDGERNLAKRRGTGESKI
ncbi:thioesterase-like superfamily-domain-containing protein, partial [Biscogniauxia mediterranea]